MSTAWLYGDVLGGLKYISDLSFDSVGEYSRITQTAPFPDLATAICVIIRIHFRGTIQQRPTEGLQERFLLGYFGQPKVREFDAQWVQGRNQDVVWFDITMRDSALV